MQGKDIHKRKGKKEGGEGERERSQGTRDKEQRTEDSGKVQDNRMAGWQNGRQGRGKR